MKIKVTILIISVLIAYNSFFSKYCYAFDPDIQGIKLGMTEAQVKKTGTGNASVQYENGRVVLVQMNFCHKHSPNARVSCNNDSSATFEQVLNNAIQKWGRPTKKFKNNEYPPRGCYNPKNIREYSKIAIWNGDITVKDKNRCDSPRNALKNFQFLGKGKIAVIITCYKEGTPDYVKWANRNDSYDVTRIAIIDLDKNSEVKGKQLF